MNLTPPPSTPPVVKRSRAKTSTAAGKESTKPTLTTKATRSRKKSVTAPAVASSEIEATVSYTSDQLRSMIATAAYLRAASRNFSPGNEVEDWLVAEQQVMASLG